MPDYPYALQLYSVRDYCEKNPEDAFRQVKQAGYDFVETAGFYGLEGAEYKKILEASGLTPISMHVGMEELIGNLDLVLRNAELLSISYIVIPWLGSETCPEKTHWMTAIHTMNDLGLLCKKSGVQLCYHNHAHEFEYLEGKTIFDLIFGHSDADALHVQLDTCWAAIGGMDVVALLNQYAGRIPLVHVKDALPCRKGEKVVFSELGNGIMNWQNLLPACQAAGVRWFIVEQDESQGDSMKSASVNAEFMKQWNIRE
jgi:sugar phosphate isomerase/epimerase